MDDELNKETNANLIKKMALNKVNCNYLLMN